MSLPWLAQADPEVYIEPDFRVPPLIGTAVMRRDIGNQIGGVVREMLNRHAAGRDSPAPRDENRLNEK